MKVLLNLISFSFESWHLVLHFNLKPSDIRQSNGCCLLQVHYEWWRRILKYFWMTVVMYTMLVLTIVYTFQFDGSDNFWKSALNVTDDKWVTTDWRRRTPTRLRFPSQLDLSKQLRHQTIDLPETPWILYQRFPHVNCYYSGRS